MKAENSITSQFWKKATELALSQTENYGIVRSQRSTVTLIFKTKNHTWEYAILILYVKFPKDTAQEA